MKKQIIRLTENDLHRIIKNTIKEIKLGSQSFHGDNPTDWYAVEDLRRNRSAKRKDTDLNGAYNDAIQASRDFRQGHSFFDDSYEGRSKSGRATIKGMHKARKVNEGIGNWFNSGKKIEYASPESHNYQKNYKGKVIDNCDGTYNDVNNYNKNEKGIREGVGNWLKGAAVGAAMMGSHANAQNTSMPNDSIGNDTISTAYHPSMQIEDIAHQIEENTDSNYVDIHEAEQIMMEDERIADEIRSACFMDEYDNLKTLDSRDIRTLDEEDYDILENEIKQGKKLVLITIDNTPNCIIDLDELKRIISEYDEDVMSEYN